MKRESKMMMDLLSMPKRPQLNTTVQRETGCRSGLPINSLPGWELIPLNCKLPMLKCPGNQVIFTKNKIGKSLRNLKQEFDPSGRDATPEYNPLHDTNLSSFYSNERNLKRLRQNGEITLNNDVICTLKDFNEHRQTLHKAHLYYVLQELNRIETEHNDRMLVTNAEEITCDDQLHMNLRYHNTDDVQERKRLHDEQRAERFLKLWEQTELRFERIEGINEMQRVLMEHRKALNKMRLQQVWEVCADIKRKHMIAMKKLFQFKKDRVRRNLMRLQARKIREANAGKLESWEKRLTERINYQKHINCLLEELEARRQVFITNHHNCYVQKWKKIQQEIKQRAKAIKDAKKPKKRKRRKPPALEPPRPCNELVSYCDDFEDSFNKMLDSELCEALNTVIDIDEEITLPFNDDDPIYKAAKFITHHILMKFDQDLSNDKKLIELVSGRVGRYFASAKRFVMFRATQIITSTREAITEPLIKKGARVQSMGSIMNFTRRQTVPKNVSFSRIRGHIGQSSYEIHPQVNVRDVTDRMPTPSGSLASITVDKKDMDDDKEEQEAQQMKEKKQREDHMHRNVKIFTEHYVIKFKRELIVGMGRRVFGAIDCHFKNKIMDVRKELLELDQNFLVCQMTKAILGYARNPLDFEACIKLCISTLSSEIIWSLQKHLLKPERDPRGIVEPRQCCFCDDDRMKLCLFCDV